MTFRRSFERAIGSLLAFALWTAFANADEPPTANLAGPAALKLTQTAVERGTLAVSIDWADTARPENREALALVLLFQPAGDAALTLNADLLERLSNQFEMGVLLTNSTWVERSIAGAPKAIVLIVVNGDARKPNTTDFRSGGPFRVDLRMAYSGNPLLTQTARGKVQAGLFELVDPKSGHETSTRYRPLSNVIEVK